MTCRFYFCGFVPIVVTLNQRRYRNSDSWPCCRLISSSAYTRCWLQAKPLEYSWSLNTIVQTAIAISWVTAQLLNISRPYKQKSPSRKRRALFLVVWRSLLLRHGPADGLGNHFSLTPGGQIEKLLGQTDSLWKCVSRHVILLREEHPCCRDTSWYLSLIALYHMYSLCQVTQIALHISSFLI